MRKFITAIGVVLAIAAFTPGATAHTTTPVVLCTGTVAAHQGNCKIVIYRYRDGFVPTGKFDVGSFPQTLVADFPACGWQEDLVQANADTPAVLTDPYYFNNHDWFVAAVHGGTVACVTTTTSTTSTTVPKATTTTTTTPRVVVTIPPPVTTPPPVAPPAEPVPVQPTFTG